MSEIEAIERALEQETRMAERQELFKQLWRIHRERERSVSKKLTATPRQGEPCLSSA